MEALDRNEYARRFRESQQLIVTASQNRYRYLQQMASCIEDCQAAVERAKRQQPQAQFSRDTGELVNAREKLVQQLTLSLIVFGRSNTGKSTLLNQILRQWPDEANSLTLFPTAGHNCSARVAVVKYGPLQEIRVKSMGPGPVMELEKRTFQCSESIRDFMDLETGRRESEEELRKQVEIQLPHPLLRAHLQVVDSPGMGENQCMNKVVQDFLCELKSGIIIYVVDGKEGYKPNPDSENIKFLMEQPVAVQRLIVANRVDFDFFTWFKDLPEDDALWDIDDDPIEEVLIGLSETMNFDYTQHCERHTATRLSSVRQQVEQRHADYLTDGRNAEELVIGVSAKSVKDFIANQLQLSHAPYLDSFMQLESRIAALVYDNGRHHLLDAARVAQQQLMQTKTLSMNFYCDQSERSNEMMRLLEKSIKSIHEIYKHICISLNSVVECNSLDLSNEGSAINRLKMRFVREDITPEQQIIDTSLMMRETEANFVESLVRASSGTREAKLAIRLLCDFKDMIVSQLRTILMWNYKMIFMVEANKPLSKLDAECKRLLDSLKSQSTQISGGSPCEDVIMLVRSQMFSPDPSVFDNVCTAILAESMRQALGAAVRRDEFRRITDSLTPQSNRLEEDRNKVLTYFMDNVNLLERISDVIIEYKSQLKDQMLFVDNLLSALLHNLREQGTRTQDELKVMRSHNEKMSAMSFYIDALITEANWTADYEISLQEFQNQCTSQAQKWSHRRLQRRLQPRFSGPCQQHGHVLPSELILHYRLIRMQQDDARRLASDMAQVKSRIAGPVRLSWLSLAETYQGHMEEPDARLLIGFDGNFASLASLPPKRLTKIARLALLRRLVECWAGVTGLTYKPSDYRPTCILLRRRRQDESTPNEERGLDIDGLVLCEAFPDPTQLVTADGESASSLVACAVALFFQESRDNDDDAMTDPAEDPYGWEARHGRELQLSHGNRTRYLAGLRRRLAEAGWPEGATGVLSQFSRACLEASDFESGSYDNRSAASLEKSIQDARNALLSASVALSEMN